VMISGEETTCITAASFGEFGSYAQYHVVMAIVALKPANLSHIEASLPVASGTT